MISDNRIKTFLKKYGSKIIRVAGMANMTTCIITPEGYLRLYQTTGDKTYLAKYLRLTKSNNWLKMHGYPIRRRG